METKKISLYRKKQLIWIMALFMFCITTQVVNAGAPSGIGGNGTGGIYIDINAAPYTNYANIPTWGQYAYGPSGCAWFASARVNQLTGANCTIYSGSSWYNSAYKSFGFSRGGNLQAKALACYENHVAVVESVDGNTAVVSEGGYSDSNSNANTGYCIIHTMSKSTLESARNGKFLGYVYLGTGSSAPSGNLSYSSINVEWTDTWNALLKGIISNPNRLTVSSVGVQIWDSAGNMVVNHSEACGLNTSTVNQELNIVGEALPTGLRQGETYTFRMWANANGVTYESETRSFTIKDDQAPIITDISVSELSETGYTVHCTVTDNFRVDRVQFPTWTLYNDQDDIVPDWGTNSQCSGTADGNSYTYRVNISDHNYEMGEYLTHIYAYDPAGNVASDFVPVQIIEEKQEEPVEPENPIQPENPAEPENPVQPENPTQPGGSDDSENQKQPENPTEPQEPTDTEDMEQGAITITFDANGGINLSRSSVTLKKNQMIVNMPSVQRKGYIFKGWYTEKTGGVKMSYYTRVTKSQTLYARWEKVVKPKKVTINSLKKQGKGKFQLKYKKIAGVDGYEISYSTNKKFKSSTKKINTTSLSKKVTKLKKNKTYYVRVRAYKVDSIGSKVYGSYSKIKKVKV